MSSMSSIEKAVDKLQTAKNLEPSNRSIRREPIMGAGYEQHVPERPDNSAGRDRGKSSGRYECIDLVQLGQAGMLTPNVTNSLIAEEYRRIKRPILQNAYGIGAQLVDNGNLILITSSLPGEGKTFTAINLAMSIATEIDKTVLLVDADMTMCGISATLGLEVGLGLADLLVDEHLSLSDVMISTNVSKLSILSAGRNRGNAAELLSSESMQRLVGDLAHRYPDRIILFDAPPLVASSEAGVLSGLMGQIIIVVEVYKTSQRQVKQAVLQLDQSKAIGFILNKGQKSAISTYGGYGYGPRPTE